MRLANADAEQYRRSVKFAAPILTALALLITALLLWVLVAKIGGIAGVVTPAVAAPIILASLLLLLESWRLGTITGRRIGSALLAGVPGLRKRLTDLIEDRGRL